MSLRWSPSAYEDLRRIHAFLEPVDPAAAIRAVQAVVARDYEIRYEVSGGDLYVLRIVHTREHR